MWWHWPRRYRICGFKECAHDGELLSILIGVWCCHKRGCSFDGRHCVSGPLMRMGGKCDGLNRHVATNEQEAGPISAYLLLVMFVLQHGLLRSGLFTQNSALSPVANFFRPQPPGPVLWQTQNFRSTFSYPLSAYQVQVCLLKRCAKRLVQTTSSSKYSYNGSLLCKCS